MCSFFFFNSIANAKLYFTINCRENGAGKSSRRKGNVRGKKRKERERNVYFSNHDNNDGASTSVVWISASSFSSLHFHFWNHESFTPNKSSEQQQQQQQNTWRFLHPNKKVTSKIDVHIQNESEQRRQKKNGLIRDTSHQHKKQCDESQCELTECRASERRRRRQRKHAHTPPPPLTMCYFAWNFSIILSFAYF